MKTQHHQFDFTDVLLQGARKIGVSLPQEAPVSMLRHTQLLLEWNAKTNLTSLRDPTDIIALHFLDSLTVFKVLPSTPGLRILDVGTGAGFPGMVLKIVDRSLEITLLDRDPRKIVFLKHLAHHLDLPGVAFLNVSVEKLLHEAHPLSFDVVVSRALTSEENFLDSLHKVLQRDGFLITMTGPSSAQQGLVLRHFSLKDQWEGHLPFLHAFRRVTLYSRRPSLC